jgi:hypothetical protein
VISLCDGLGCNKRRLKFLPSVLFVFKWVSCSGSHKCFYQEVHISSAGWCGKYLQTLVNLGFVLFGHLVAIKFWQHQVLCKIVHSLATVSLLRSDYQALAK